MNKVVKLALICEQKDKDGNDVDYKEINGLLWELQRQTREIKNKTIQYCWEWNGFSSDYNKLHNEYPKEKDILLITDKKTGECKSATLEGFINDRFKNNNDLYSANASMSSRETIAAFKNAKKEIISGERSILFYKRNQPLDLHNKSICLNFIDNTFYVKLKLFNTSAVKKNNFKDSTVNFKVLVRDNSTKTILERCFDGIYGISGSKLIYKKNKWFLNLSYSFEAKEHQNLDKDKILGVDLGIHYPICASVYGDLHRFTIDGGEIEEFRRRVENRKITMLKQGKNCGDGRIGHGIAARNKPVYAIEDRIARFRDTANHKYSRALIDYAVKNGCGTIQMEDLKGITKDTDKFLKNWSYYDLQQKIEYKAKEVGIEVKKIAPKYTSQRCSKCGAIHKDSRPTQARFKCVECGFEENADFNASQNIAIKNIDKLIEKDVQ